MGGKISCCGQQRKPGLGLGVTEPSIAGRSVDLVLDGAAPKQLPTAQGQPAEAEEDIKGPLSSVESCTTREGVATSSSSSVEGDGAASSVGPSPGSSPTEGGAEAEAEEPRGAPGEAAGGEAAEAVAAAASPAAVELDLGADLGAEDHWGAAGFFEPPASLEAPATVAAADQAAPADAGEAEAEAVDEVEELLRRAREAALQGRVALAWECYEAARRLRTDVEDAALTGLAERRHRMEAMRQALSPAGRSGSTWRHFVLDTCELWRCWDSVTGNIKVVLQWESPGNIEQFVGSIRDSHLCEPLWNGECYDMWTQHHGGLTLTRWLQKDAVLGRKQEVILERTLCDCLDDEAAPCWMLLERSPLIQGFESFSGHWGGFDIPAVPEGYMRTVTAESGRILQPVGPNSTRCTLLLDIEVPSFIRWLVTDSLLQIGVNRCAKGFGAAWEKILEGWHTLPYDECMREHEAFYGPMRLRAKDFLARL